MSRQAQLATVPDVRALLRAAIEQHHTAMEHSARVAAATTHAQETLFAAMQAVHEAEAATAESQQGARLAAIALGEATGFSAADAAAELTRKQNDVTTARATHEALQRRAERERAEVERTQRELKYAAVAVMCAEVPVAELLAKAQALQTELVAARAELREIYSLNCVADEQAKAVERFMLDRDLPAYGQPEWQDYSAHPAAVAWRNTLAQLQTNAEVQLPV